jgi:hypothetical protein
MDVKARPSFTAKDVELFFEIFSPCFGARASHEHRRGLACLVQEAEGSG